MADPDKLGDLIIDTKDRDNGCIDKVAAAIFAPIFDNAAPYLFSIECLPDCFNFFSWCVGTARNDNRAANELLSAVARDTTLFVIDISDDAIGIKA